MSVRGVDRKVEVKGSDDADDHRRQAREDDLRSTAAFRRSLWPQVRRRWREVRVVAQEDGYEEDNSRKKTCSDNKSQKFESIPETFLVHARCVVRLSHVLHACRAGGYF